MEFFAGVFLIPAVLHPIVEPWFSRWQHERHARKAGMR